MLLGIGVSTLYYNLANNETHKLKFTRTLVLSAGGLILSLLSSAILVPLNGWKSTKFYGMFLIFVYFSLMTINLIVETVYSRSEN